MCLLPPLMPRLIRPAPALVLGLVLGLGAGLPGPPALAQDYGRLPEHCREGALIDDARDGLRIGKGQVRIDGLTCTRVSDRQLLAEGWYRAAWDCADGSQSYGRLQFDLRLTESLVQLRTGDKITDYPRCP